MVALKNIPIILLSILILTQSQAVEQKVKPDVQVEGEEDNWDQLGNAPEEVRAIGKVLKEWFESCAAGDLEKVKKAYLPSKNKKAERDLQQIERFLEMVPDWHFSLLGGMWDGNEATAVSNVLKGLEDPASIVSGPLVLVWHLNKVDGQWRLANNFVGERLEKFQQYVAQSKKKNPNLSVWLHNSYSSLLQETNVLKEAAEAFEKGRWGQLEGTPKEVQDIGKVLRKWFGGCLAGDLERVKDTFVPNKRSKAEEHLKEMRQYLAMAPGWQFSPMVIRMSDSIADAISHDFVISAKVPEYSGDPVIIIVQLMKVDGQWGILGWSGDSLRSISHAYFQRKYPQSRIWFDKSIPDWLKPDQQTDVEVDIEELKGISEKVKPGYSFAEKVRAITGDKEIFESYFTDSIESGKALDQWWPKRNEDPDVDKKIFGMVRNGLRRDSRGKERRYRNQYIRWIGQKYIWGQKPQNKEAIELMYYATFDPQLASDAVYYGLSVVVGKKNDKVLKRFVELCMANVNVNRILWGTKGQHEGMLEYLEPYLTSGDLQIKSRAGLETDLTVITGRCHFFESVRGNRHVSDNTTEPNI